MTINPQVDDRANCRGAEPEMFFAEGGFRQYDEARALCFRCPLREDCRQFADDEGLYYGMYGGYTPDERAALRKRRGDRRTYRTQKMIVGAS